MLAARDLKRKIRSVRNIQQICRAMKLVASAKLRRAELRLRQARAYGDRLQGIVSRLANAVPDHPFFAPRPIRCSGFVLITADKGLCGAFNANVLRLSYQQTRRAEGEAAVVALGHKGRDFFRRRGYRLLDELVPLTADPVFTDIAPLADRLGQRFLAGEIDDVFLIYSRFLSSTRSRPMMKPLLPIRPEEGAAGPTEILFEPPPAQLLEFLLPRYLRTVLYTAALESSASEHGARVVAMTTASDNAEELIRNLTKVYNAARQTGITKEILDIVGAAEALR